MRGGALSQAIDLALAPTLAAHQRRQPLPGDVLTLIRVAAGRRESLDAAMAATGRSPDFLRAAAESYLRQVVCHPGADSYRILGVSPPAARTEMRRHMRELVLWLHPDRGGDAWNAALMRRVVAAWQDVGRRTGGGPEPARPRGRMRRVPVYRPIWIARPLTPHAAAATGRRLWSVLRVALVTAGLMVPALGVLVPLMVVAEPSLCAGKRSPVEGGGVTAVGRGGAAMTRCGA